MKKAMHKLGIHLPTTLKLHCNPMEGIYHPVEWSETVVDKTTIDDKDLDVEEQNRVQFNKSMELATGMVIIEQNHDHHHHFQAFYNLIHIFDYNPTHNHKPDSQLDSKSEHNAKSKDGSYEYSNDHKYNFRFWHHDKRQHHHNEDHHHHHHRKRFGLKKHCKSNFIAPEICIQDIMTRVAILRKVYHPNLMPLKSIYDDDKYLYFIYVLHDDIQLLTTAIQNLDEAYTESLVKNWIHQILLGLNYLHEHGVTHGDLSLNSLFYRTTNEQVYIGRYEGNRLRPKIPDSDEGLNLEQRLRRIHQIAITAPEVGEGKRYGQAADIYSLGVVAHLLLTGEYPNQPSSSNSKHNSNTDLLHPNHNINNDSSSNLSVGDDHVTFQISRSRSIRSIDTSSSTPNFPPHSHLHPNYHKEKHTELLSPLAKNLLQQLMAHQDCARPTAKQALTHPWFSTSSNHSIGSNGTGEQKGFNLGLVMRLGTHVSPEHSQNNTSISLSKQPSHK